MNAVTPHIVAAPVKLVPDYIARLEADLAQHKRGIDALDDRIDRALKGMGQ